MAGGQTGQRLAANWAVGRRGVRFGLRAALDRLAEQFLHFVRGLNFGMAKVLIADEHQPLNRTVQRTRGPGGQHRQRFG